MAKILLLDIETSPYTALVWGVRKQYLSSHNLVDTAGVLCWAAKWLGDQYTYFDSVQRSGEEGMLSSVHAMLEEADVVITYNGNSFDLPILNREFLKIGKYPPKPYASLDLYRKIRSKFRFPSNKLDDVLKELGFEGKSKHRGMQLWIDCMAGKRDAWKEMETYNVQDVTELENLYVRILPWIDNHPNLSVIEGTECCTNCGSKKLEKRGPRRMASGLFQRLRCTACGTWLRSSIREEAAPSRMIHER
jgi:DNA polymerase elongation subunit (family B)